MSKSKYPKWFNPTQDHIFDDYYITFWTLLGGGSALYLIAIAIKAIA